MKINANVIDIYNKNSQSYDSYWSDYLRDSLKRPIHSISQIILESNSKLRILDLGSGTGCLFAGVISVLESNPNYPDLITKVDLVGLEPAHDMLEVAKSKLKRYQNQGWNIEFIQASAIEPPFVDDSFDLITSTNALHFFGSLTDIKQSFIEMNRILKSGGMIVLTDWCQDYLVTKIICLGMQFTDYFASRALFEEEIKQIGENQGFQLEHFETFKISLWWALFFAIYRKP